MINEHSPEIRGENIRKNDSNFNLPVCLIYEQFVSTHKVSNFPDLQIN
jgi:hypothetical protein